MDAAKIAVDSPYRGAPALNLFSRLRIAFRRFWRAVAWYFREPDPSTMTEKQKLDWEWFRAIK